VTKGVILFAHNNAAFEYHRLVPICAWFVKKHLKVPVALVTDAATHKRLMENPGIEQVIDQFIFVEHTESNGTRAYQDHDNTVPNATAGVFLNKTRTDMYELTPFEETIFMDLDYIVMNDSLSKVWGSAAPVRINHSITSLRPHHAANDEFVHPLGIPLYWSTVMYFRKSPEAEAMFQGIRHIKNNPVLFSMLYRFSENLFRNDMAVSIMAHCMNGGVGPDHSQAVVQALPEPTLLFAWDDQPLLQVDQDRAWFVGNAWGEDKERAVAYVKEQSVHIVNKNSVLRVLEPWIAQQMGVSGV